MFPCSIQAVTRFRLFNLFQNTGVLSCLKMMSAYLMCYVKEVKGHMEEV